jgi:Domain of unknown function (DUF4286)
MVTYEITAVVDPALTGAYEAYMVDRHIPDVLATGHFTSAGLSRNGSRYRIRYEAASQAELDVYLSENAPALRDDRLRHFPTGVELTREIWQIIAGFLGA